MPEQIGGGTELFVVDDDVDMRDTLSLVFTQQGYQVSSFAEGNSFLAVARSRTPSCVLLDVHMPGTSGIDSSSSWMPNAMARRSSSFPPKATSPSPSTRSRTAPSISS